MKSPTSDKVITPGTGSKPLSIGALRMWQVQAIKNAQLREEAGRFLERKSELTLRVLRTLTRFTQTNFLTFNFTSIASHEASFAQSATQGFVVLHQSASDTVADCASLTTYTATDNGDVDVELFNGLGQFQRLTNYHAGSFATEEIFQSAVVDRDVTSTRTQENASGSGFATASAFLGLLSSMRVSSARIDFQLAIHVATQWALRQHTFDRDFNRGFRLFGDQAFEVRRLDTAWETGVTVVHFVLRFVAGNTYLLGVDDDNVVTGINVRGVLRLVLATQTAGDFSGQTTQGLTSGVDDKPVALNCFWFCSKSCSRIQTLSGARVGASVQRQDSSAGGASLPLQKEVGNYADCQKNFNLLL
eukprot:gene21671-25721_t